MKNQRGYYNFQPDYFLADAISKEASIGSKTGNFLLDEHLKQLKKEKKDINKILKKLKKTLENF